MPRLSLDTKLQLFCVTIYLTISGIAAYIHYSSVPEVAEAAVAAPRSHSEQEFIQRINSPREFDI